LVLRAIKVCSTPSFGGEVKPEALCCKILWHVRITSKSKRYTLHGQIHHSLPDVPASRIARELWWTNQEVSSVNIMVLDAHILLGA
jgi:hypothetical protein